MNFSGTMAGSYIEMKAPEWLCSVICAGFEVDDILDDARAKATTPVLTSLNTNFNTIISTSQEEQDVLNVNKNQINSVAQTPSHYKNECVNIQPNADDCIQ